MWFIECLMKWLQNFRKLLNALFFITNVVSVWIWFSTENGGNKDNHWFSKIILFGYRYIFLVYIWCGPVYGWITVLLIVEGCLTVYGYLQFLQSKITLVLEEVSFYTIVNVVCCTSFGWQVTQFLNWVYWYHQISCRGLEGSPVQSPEVLYLFTTAHLSVNQR
jgi:hypothetical protein